MQFCCFLPLCMSASHGIIHGLADACLCAHFCWLFAVFMPSGMNPPRDGLHPCTRQVPLHPRAFCAVRARCSDGIASATSQRVAVINFAEIPVRERVSRPGMGNRSKSDHHSSAFACSYKLRLIKWCVNTTQAEFPGGKLACCRWGS